MALGALAFHLAFDIPLGFAFEQLVFVLGQFANFGVSGGEAVGPFLGFKEYFLVIFDGWGLVLSVFAVQSFDGVPHFARVRAQVEGLDLLFPVVSFFFLDDLPAGLHGFIPAAFFLLVAWVTFCIFPGGVARFHCLGTVGVPEDLTVWFACGGNVFACSFRDA